MAAAQLAWLKRGASFSPCRRRSTAALISGKPWDAAAFHSPTGAGPGQEAAASYQRRVFFTMATTDSITGTSTSTPTTVASAAPELRP